MLRLIMYGLGAIGLVGLIVWLWISMLFRGSESPIDYVTMNSDV